MKILIAFFTRTGNTRKVAEAIHAALPGETELAPLESVETLEGYDLVFIGFPVMQFGPPAVVRNFINVKAAGRKIALFVTHAMISGSNDPQQELMLSKELEKCRLAARDADLVGFFHCRGELSEEMAAELNASKIPMLMEFASLRPLTLGHPTEEERMEAARFAASLAGPAAPR